MEQNCKLFAQFFFTKHEVEKSEWSYLKNKLTPLSFLWILLFLEVTRCPSYGAMIVKARSQIFFLFSTPLWFFYKLHVWKPRVERAHQKLSTTRVLKWFFSQKLPKLTNINEISKINFTSKLFSHEKFLYGYQKKLLSFCGVVAIHFCWLSSLDVCFCPRPIECAIHWCTASNIWKKNYKRMYEKYVVIMVTTPLSWYES